MLLWQGVALAAVLSALGAGLSLATVHGAGTPSAPRRSSSRRSSPSGCWPVRAPGRYVAARRSPAPPRAARPADRPAGRDRPGISVLETEQPLAYCVPSLRTSRVVVSQGALDRLAPDELDAVLAHERAHLRARHDLVLEAFSVLHQAFPRWVSSASALREVRMLVEVLADRVAARDAGARASGARARRSRRRTRSDRRARGLGVGRRAGRPDRPPALAAPAPSSRARHHRRGRRRRTAHRVRRRSLARRSSLALGFDTALARLLNRRKVPLVEQRGRPRPSVSKPRPAQLPHTTSM